MANERSAAVSARAVSNLASPRALAVTNSVAAERISVGRITSLTATSSTSMPAARPARAVAAMIDPVSTVSARVITSSTVTAAQTSRNATCAAR
ncbi:Uncharacterised protein [Mycobacteroides abscessus subsp. abscessus]|nr:Uncharacterised protein [Mycobacteroides abscessus subsp. abscessus]